MQFFDLKLWNGREGRNGPNGRKDTIDTTLIWLEF